MQSWGFPAERDLPYTRMKQLQSLDSPEVGMTRIPPVLLLPLGLFVGVLASAATAGPAAAQSTDGFLFKTPSVTMTFRGGYAVPSAGSEIFDFVQEQLTVEKRDFNTVTLAGEVAVQVADRVDVAVGLGFARSIKRSEFRDWIGDDGLPIEQSTELSRIPVTVSAKYYLMDRGRSVSSLAWIPTRWSPYVGLGGGFVSYDFEQAGEFVDFETLDIFRDVLLSGGKTGTAHIMAGADLSLNPRFLLNAEGRYSWASAEMSQDFSGFDNVDLSGFQATLGIGVRF